MIDVSAELRTGRRYVVLLLDGSHGRVENQNDASEHVERGTASEWWWEEPFGSWLIEREPKAFKNKVVNLAGKSGGLWERTTIIDYRDGRLILEGGSFIRNTFQPEPERYPVGERYNRIYPFDVARGFVWGP